MNQAAEPANRSVSWGFGWGTAAGVLLTLFGLLLMEPDTAVAGTEGLGKWIGANLGHSAWLFAVVLALYLMNLTRLNRILQDGPEMRTVAELDQLSDVWIHLFVGIGVIWTAVGMRSALQTALGDPTGALTDTAGSVLQRMVDGGILLALTTTIVGGVGGYLMRLAKTMIVGATLHGFYEAAQRADLVHLLRTVDRIDARLAAGNGTGNGTEL